MSIRECARIQTFPDDYIFYYRNLTAGYKMVGNAVPCNLASLLGKAIKQQIESQEKTQKKSRTTKTTRRKRVVECKLFEQFMSETIHGWTLNPLLNLRFDIPQLAHVAE